MTIAMMSLNRYFFICSHDWYERLFTKQTCVGICISLYSIGIVIVLLNQIDIGNHGFDHKSIECIWDRMASYPYTVVFSIVLVWVPIMITGISYGRIYYYVVQHRRRVQQKQVTSSHAPVKSLRLAKTLFVIYAIFSICWIPYALLLVVDYKDDLPHELHLYITMFAHLHPSLNWLIYYVTNERYRHAYKEIIFACLCLCCKGYRNRSEELQTDNGRSYFPSVNRSSYKWKGSQRKKSYSPMKTFCPTTQFDRRIEPMLMRSATPETSL